MAFLRSRTLGALLGAGALAASLGVLPAGAAEAGSTEALCPVTDPLIKAKDAPHQQLSLIRSYLGCQHV